jgi:mannose-6-phosphate isomerase-like protein (cupin superfamily)
MTITTKPWGQEELIEFNDRYMVKKLTMWKGHRCSLQFHNRKQETIYILSGILKISTGLSPQELTSRIYKEHDSITLVPSVIHRMEAVEDSIYLEASTPEIDDVVRLSDDYNRLTS